MRIGKRRRSHRISGEDLERCFEIARHVCLYKVTNIRFLLYICGENGISEELCFDGRARETCQSTKRAVDGNITWSDELYDRGLQSLYKPPGQARTFPTQSPSCSGGPSRRNNEAAFS